MYTQLLLFIVGTLVLLGLSRLSLMAWQHQRVRAVHGVGAVLRGGLRIDAHLIALGAAPGLALAPWLAATPAAIAAHGVWLQAAWLLIVLLEVSTPLFIIEYDTRPNRLYVDYLKHPREVAGMLFKGYKMALLMALLPLAGAAVLGHALFGHAAPDRLPWGWAGGLLAWLAGALLAFVAIRGTLQHRPINPSSVAFCRDPLVNALALNSLYSVMYAIYSKKHERSAAQAYGAMPDQAVLAQVVRAARLPAESIDPAIPTLRRHRARGDAARRPRHLVMIVEESLGSRYAGHLGGQGLTPCLDALSQQAWCFTQAHATGTRSVRGLEALVAGFPPALSEAVLKLPDAQSRFFTIAQLLRGHGFRSRFVYGGEAHFDNMKGFLLGNGFDELHDRKTFEQPAFCGTWGASDEDMFERVHGLLSQPSAQPTFTLAFTVSNHSPWEYPAGRIAAQGAPASVDNSVRYADWALGAFFERARRSRYWDDTVFLVVADHEARVTGRQLVPVKEFHIPALILGASVAARRDDRLISQIDLPATLVSLMGLSGEHPMIGHDLNDPAAGGRALMQYGENFGYLKDDRLLVLAPQRPATQWHYQAPGDYTPQAVDAALHDEARAHALWPDLAYRRGGYTLPGLRIDGRLRARQTDTAGYAPPADAAPSSG